MIKQSRLNKLNTLLKFYQKQLTEQLIKQQYQQKTLNQLRNYHRSITHNTNTSPELNHFSRISYESKNDEDISLLSESILNLSAQLQKISPSRSKKTIVSYEMQYENCCKQIAKLSSQLAQRQNANINIKKSSFMCPPSKKNSSIMRPKTSRNIDFIKVQWSQIQNLKSQRQIKELTDKDKKLEDIGNNCILGSNDEVVNNLVKNMRSEQEKYIDLIAENSQIGLRTRIKNYMQRAAQKNQQLSFKLKQQAVDRALTKIQGNRQTIKKGYTLKMQHFIQQALNN